ncbi:hypothetical protein [Bradyrhizobium elkanii]|uniref:hypothetical protein n=1 Tax=Bradyrhizobium elkanii TaxID=29448 RepID=UPI003513AB80
MSLKLSNNASGRLAVSVSGADTTILLQAGQGARFPALSAGDWFPITVVRTDGTHEIMYVTAISGDTMTVQRGRENTPALAFVIGDRVELRATAGVFRRIVSAIGALGPRVGDIKPWRGSISDIASVHGPGWQLADGTNGTVDLRDRFVVGAGASYAPGDTGGASTVALASNQMPAHNHAVTDPGHVHSVSDPGHAHAVSDPGHSHTINNQQYVIFGNTSGAGVGGGGAFGIGNQYLLSIGASATGVAVQANHTGLSVGGASTGISTQNAGSGAAHENRPPYFALAFIEYTGIGVVDPLGLAA